MLLEGLWGSADFRDPRTIDVHVRHLREKLERDSRAPELILTVRSVGLPLPRRVNPFRRVGGRLALALLVVVAGALAIVYLIVVPSYRQLARQLTGQRPAPEAARRRWPSRGAKPACFPSAAWVQDTAVPVAAGARVVVFSAPPLLEPVADSNGGTSRDIENDPIVQRAAARRGIVGGTVTRERRELRRGGRVGDPRRPGRAALLLAAQRPRVGRGRPEADARRRRHRERRSRSCSATRSRRSSRVASAGSRRPRSGSPAGRFDETVVDPAPDELGQLARAFERMRLRLAQPRPRARRVHRERVARAADAAVLAGRLPRAARRRGDRRGDPGRVPRGDARPAEPPDEARDRPARSVADRRGAARRRRREPRSRTPSPSSLAVEFGPRAAAAGHELEVESERWVPALGDEERVRQIGRILLENAIVHTPAGTTVTISAGAAGGRATLAVADDGPGIPETAQTQVFERFYRLDGTIASGSGLGLAIARELAELMGGRIELASLPGSTRVHARACDGRRHAARAARGPSGVNDRRAAPVVSADDRTPGACSPRSRGPSSPGVVPRRRFGRPPPAGKLS